MNKFNAGNVRNYDFSKVPQTYIHRTRMFRPGSHTTSMACDYLYPLYLDEVLPGDTIRLDVASFGRLTSVIAPFMDNIYLDWQFFFVPNRLVWENWQRFCGEQDDPGDSTDYTVPYLTCPSGGVDYKSIYDYFGIPPKKSFGAHDVQSLPFRMYNLIYNEWYRDENLQDSVQVPKGDGPDDASMFTLLKRGKRKDYFTSALPAPQKGDAVTIPLLDSMTLPVRGNGLALGLEHGSSDSQRGALVQSGSSEPRILALNRTAFGQAYGSSITAAGQPPTNGSFGVTTDSSKSGLVADFNGSGTAVSINSLRQAFQLQKFFERMNRGGTRYIEILKSMFGVNSPDARLQRPELLTSFTVPLQLFQVAQSSASGDTGTPQGNLTANGTFAQAKFAFNKSFVEHGFVIGIASIRSDLSYQQGLHRMWSRSTLYDYYWPTFAHLGEQAILNKEIYLQDNSVTIAGKVANNQVFGYQERWSEYKYGQHRISGELRSSYPQSLDVWHLAQNFSDLPTLSGQFIESDTPIDRVTAVSTRTAQPFVVDTAFNAVCVRPLPLYDVPGLVDHF